MGTLFNCLTARVICDETGTHTDYYSPSGKLFATVPPGKEQPKFAKQKVVVLDGKTYNVTWSLIPQTTKKLTS